MRSAVTFKHVVLIGSLHQTISRTANNESAITNEIDSADGVGMCGEGSHDSRRSNVPQEDGFVVRTADEHVAFGRERDGVDVIMMAK